MNTRLKNVIARKIISDKDLDHSIEQIWFDLDGQVSQDRIRQVAIEVADRFHNATVTTYIPIFVRHLTRDMLKEKSKEND